MFAADSKALAVHEGRSLRDELAYSWKQIIGPVEPFLEAVSRGLEREVEAFEGAIVPYAEYALTGQGKQLRPALVALVANALGPVSQEHVTAAVIIEMVHLATLVHDDVMDEAELRRGRLTLAANWGNDIAVLFGDCLFANALTLAASFPTPEVCRAVAKATKTVCTGEILQTQHQRDFQLTRESYFKVLEMKTAELFALSCELSAFLSGSSPEQQAMLRQFGLAFGTAYQVYDDCVDLFGSEVTAGKSLGTDLAKGKLTLPMLLLRERADAQDYSDLMEILRAWQPDSMSRLAKLLGKYDTLSASHGFVTEYLEKARATLRTLPGSDGRACLLGLADYLASQTDALGREPESSL